MLQKGKTMKTLTDYTSDAISAAMEKYGAFFAFSNAQFEEKKLMELLIHKIVLEWLHLKKISNFSSRDW